VSNKILDTSTKINQSIVLLMFLNAFGHCKVGTLQKMYFHNYKIIEKDVIIDLSIKAWF